MAQLGEHLIEDASEIVPLQPHGAADAQVQVRVLGDGRGQHPFGECLDHHVLGIASVCRAQRRALLRMAPQDLISHVEHGVRPRALGQVLDDLADALLAVDEDDVTEAKALPQALGVVRQEVVVGAPRLGEHVGHKREDLVAQPAGHRRPF